MRSRWCSGTVCFRSPIREVAEPQAKQSNLHFEDVKEIHSYIRTHTGEVEKIVRSYHNYHKNKIKLGSATFEHNLWFTLHRGPLDSDSHPHKTNYVLTAAAAQPLIIRKWAAVIVKTMTKTWWCFKCISGKTLNCNMRCSMYALGTFLKKIYFWTRAFMCSTVQLTLVSLEHHIIAESGHFHKTPAIALRLWGFWHQRAPTYFGKYNLCHFLWLFLYQAVLFKGF